ncbi:L-rhamnose/proton symporter RhaT [Sphingobacterium sp.]|uniref:L-rhamnose/proton symporter RhaT n=1 Tax=Sphingobacterium sp. TaxID=341027 RepID=UPI0028AFF253|nr:L-rhamnose/proton symporter RhaT [Sphingobacterium sp.]
MSLLSGILFHLVGAFSASICYTPQNKVKNWSWQTFWLAQASVCWIILPLIVAFLTIPNLYIILTEAPSKAMWTSFLLGFVYGIGGTAFGIAIRYVGFSLTYAISVGISCVLGTLAIPIYKGELVELANRLGFNWIILGISVGILGIALCGKAGYSKERDFKIGNISEKFSFSKGLPICILAGVLAAFYSFSLDQGQPIADVAEKYGAGSFQGNVIYLFSNSGAFLSTLIFCLFLHLKEKTFSEFFSSKKSGLNKSSFLFFNYFLAILTGSFWYLQFFFYGLGHNNMGEFKFSSWAIHMILLVLVSNIVGLILKEWKSSGITTRKYLGSALVVLILSVLILTYGNYLGIKE